ncbi:hypothetical protein ACQ4WM_01830 [Janthinobacterium sp. RB2R34]
MRQIGASGETGKRNKPFFSVSSAVFFAARTGVAGICTVSMVHAPEKRIAPCGSEAIAPKNGTHLCIEE